MHDYDQNQAQINSNVVGIAPARVPLPHGLAEDGPIYVNAKQYHGILRRRQSRAKLEAQNKVIRNRKVIPIHQIPFEFDSLFQLILIIFNGQLIGMESIEVEYAWMRRNQELKASLCG